jgi:hypothetical protein
MNKIDDGPNEKKKEEGQVPTNDSLRAEKRDKSHV